MSMEVKLNWSHNTVSVEDPVQTLVESMHPLKYVFLICPDFTTVFQLNVSQQQLKLATTTN